jgi:hypothetical protein
MSDEKIDERDLTPDDKDGPLTLEDAAEEISATHSRSRAPVGEDDDETWTNQPKEAGAAEDDKGDFVDDADGDQEDDEEADQGRAPRRVIQNGRDVICEELPDRAQRAALRFKPFLTGSIVFEFPNSGERFLFDWRDDLPTTKPLAREVSVTCDESKGFVSSASAANVDTVIAISEAHLMAVRSGSLNPQVGMLTDKIKVKGKVGPAVYIFNLVAPRVRH